ncbi:MAG: TRAP transporter small permease [Burkholderiaceae bacterium]|nr:TRAP transporter small permease [Burkholderiaceae bacterium]MCD8517877.1 TRAP transporter small permease [Burkholderiaceae bacterium]MCD8538297.1 TRAP transporter small permease [Burkholderiaceae bacterium]MCD8565381.1 TRAP transporter small permease [Burkholderiaceae bacterium]
MIEGVLRGIKAVNRLILIGLGIMLWGGVMIVLLDITLRLIGSSLGGTDEISGYLMAILAAWGMGYTLTALGHIRIEALRDRCSNHLKLALDVLAIASVAVVVTLIAVKGWPVFERSWLNGSRANTPLETLLWTVQLPWFLGWAWFALVAWVQFLASLIFIARGNQARAFELIGTANEGTSES